MRPVIYGCFVTNKLYTILEHLCNIVKPGSHFLRMLHAMRISLRHKGEMELERLLHHQNLLPIRIRWKYEPGFTNGG